MPVFLLYEKEPVICVGAQENGHAVKIPAFPFSPSVLHFFKKRRKIDTERIAQKDP
ncbi:hypothetical protein B425_2091 [Bacillus amyloliquefaciens]|nr:hypothetical protein B425_2091 [Bacillus amyloliquefaciens]